MKAIDAKAIEDVKNIASRYGHKDDFLAARDELKAVAKRLNLPLTVSEENQYPEQTASKPDLRHRSIMLGKKGSGLEQHFSLPPFDPNQEMHEHDAELLKLI